MSRFGRRTSARSVKRRCRVLREETSAAKWRQDNTAVPRIRLMAPPLKFSRYSNLASSEANRKTKCTIKGWNVKKEWVVGGGWCRDRAEFTIRRLFFVLHCVEKNNEVKYETVSVGRGGEELCNRNSNENKKQTTHKRAHTPTHTHTRTQDEATATINLSRNFTVGRTGSTLLGGCLRIHITPSWLGKG